MLKKVVTGLALVAAVTLLVPQNAFARNGHGGFHSGGFRGGGGFRGFHGGGSFRGFAAGPRVYGGGRNYGAWNNGYRWRNRGYGWRYPYYGAAIGGLAAGAYGAYYAGSPYYYGYDDACYQLVTAYGPYGPYTQRVWVCD